jgi:hypothetical protein
MALYRNLAPGEQARSRAGAILPLRPLRDRQQRALGQRRADALLASRATDEIGKRTDRAE